MDVPRRRRWRSFAQKPRFLLEARWAGQEARIQRFRLARSDRLNLPQKRRIGALHSIGTGFDHTVAVDECNHG